MIELNDKQSSFAQAVASGQSFAQAAVSAGYSARSSAAIGSRLAASEKVAKRIKLLKKPRLFATGEMLQQLSSCGEAPVEVFTEDGEQLGFYLPMRLNLKAAIVNGQRRPHKGPAMAAWSSNLRK